MDGEGETIKAIYQKRWKVETFHKTLKGNAALAKSPAKTVRTQSNHCFMAIYSACRLEWISATHQMNHFALRTRIFSRLFAMPLTNSNSSRLRKVYQNRADYIYHLNDIQTRGGVDLAPFASFALKGLVHELEVVHNEVLEEVRVLAFRDYARRTLADAGKLGNPAGDRQLQLLTELAGRPISVKALRSGSDPLARLYRGVTQRTLSRDLNYLREQNLVSLAGDELRARLDLMTQFTA